MTDSVPEPVVAVGSWLHHAAQPGGHGLDAHRSGGPRPRYRPAGRVLRRARPRRRRADHHRRLRAQPHRLAAAVRRADGVARRRPAGTAASPPPCTTRAARSCCRSCTRDAMHTTRSRSSASSIKAPINPFRPRKLSSRGVERTIDDFVRCALLARDAGYDGVEIMGSEGYLLNQFLAPRTNKRTDAWGGTPEKRRRMPGRDRAPHPRGGRARLHHLLPDVDGRLRRGRPELGRNRRAGNRSRGRPGPPSSTPASAGTRRGCPTIVTSVPNSAFVDISNAVAEHVDHPGGGVQPDQHAAGRRADPRRDAAVRDHPALKPRARNIARERRDVEAAAHRRGRLEPAALAEIDADAEREFEADQRDRLIVFAKDSGGIGGHGGSPGDCNDSAFNRQSRSHRRPLPVM